MPDPTASPGANAIAAEGAKVEANRAPTSRTDLPEGDTITLVIGGQRLSEWTAVTITMGIEQTPPMAELRLTFSTDSAPVTVKPFAPTELYCGRDKLITGYVTHVGYVMTPNAHEVSVRIAGKTQDLVDCSAILADGTQLFNSASLKTIATRLCEPFKIDVAVEGDDSVVAAQLVVSLTERPWDIIDATARYAQRIPYEDREGRLMLAKVGTESMASGVTQGLNVEGGSVTLDGSIRYSDYLAALSSVDPLAEAGTAGSLLRADVKDPGVPRYRPLVLVSPQVNTQGEIAVLMAKFEAARRIGRSESVHVTVSNWRDTAGRLWTINTLADAQLPALQVLEKRWLISAVTLSRGPQGQRAALVLMPPSAFTIAPSTLGAVGADITLSGTPAAPAGGTGTAQPTRRINDTQPSGTTGIG